MPAQISQAIVFLHIPKTAGQTIHNEVSRFLPRNAISPVRVHTQVATPQEQLAPGYKFYGGHLDWTALEGVGPRFVFTVLRDPRERIGSFYFYLLDKARKETSQTLAEPQNTGLNMINSLSVDDYFFSNAQPGWPRFISDHYDNFYCSYFASQKMRGWGDIKDLSTSQRVEAALTGAKSIDRIYSTLNLAQLEEDMKSRFGFEVSVVNTYVNAGSLAANTPRWDRLCALLEKDSTRAKLEAFVDADLALIEALGLEV